LISIPKNNSFSSFSLYFPEKLNQDTDQERKAKTQQPSEQTVEPTDSPTGENRGVYYKNSVLFTSTS